MRSIAVERNEDIYNISRGKPHIGNIQERWLRLQSPEEVQVTVGGVYSPFFNLNRNYNRRALATRTGGSHREQSVRANFIISSRYINDLTVARPVVEIQNETG